MDMNNLLFLIWCMGIHCMLWSLMDPAVRNAIAFLWAVVKIKIGRR